MFDDPAAFVFPELLDRMLLGLTRPFASLQICNDLICGEMCGLPAEIRLVSFFGDADLGQAEMVKQIKRYAHAI